MLPSEEIILSREYQILVKAILMKCRNCMGGCRYDCKIPACSLYRFMPYRDIPFSDEVEEETTSPVLKKRSASK